MIRMYFLTDFFDTVENYRDGKHGITSEDVGGWVPEDSYCAIRRAIRQIPFSTITQDVPIQRCIQWGLRRKALPKKWKGLPQGWPR